GGDPAKGKTYYQTCVACHGANGEGMKTLNSPNLTHLPEWYILSQLKNFKDGIRGTDPKDLYGMQMRPMAMTLPDEKAMLDVIAYIKTLKPGSVEHTESGDAAKGKSLYATCTACHGAKGEGNEALHAPSFEGQADWYMIRQLQNFKAGIRGANPKDMWGQQMRPMAMTLPDDKAIKDVVAYIKTLK
ncbi:MAG: c-type cytochrome, partial [Acidobacteria bacterium]|nr:c-type cytochrome [Acidobacteriota bacterium]